MAADRVWDVVVVGGGPAAALQVVHAGARPGGVLVATEDLGGTLAMLGRQRTQSYADELELGAPGLAVRDYTDPGAASPTGAAYVRYVRRALERSPATIVRARVEDVRPDGDDLVVAGHDRSRRPVRWRARKVVLATGMTPRALPPGLAGADGVRSCVEAYRDVDTGRLDRYRGRSLVIVGCGNTAMQLAALLAWVAGEVVVLANRYVGLYPQETMDRFAWRSLSQQTCELVVRCRQRAGDTPPAAHPSVRYLVYDGLDADGHDLVVTYARADNQNVLGRHSLPDATCAATRAVPDGPDRWRERFPLASTEVVAATGFAPSYAVGPAVGGLPRDGAGFLRHDAGGETGMPGLFVAGACAGFPAVNFMRVADRVAPAR